MVDNILEATARCIREDGFDGLNTNRVAEVAGVSIGSLYQYFHDRRELTEALLDRISGDMRQMLSQQQRLVDIGTLDIRTLARQGITVMLTFLRSDPVYLELTRNWHRLPMHRLLDPLEQHMLEAARLYFLRHSGSYPMENLQTRVYVLINSATFTMVRFISQEDSTLLREEDVIDCLVDTIALSLVHGGRNGGGGSGRSPAEDFFAEA